MTEQEWSMFWVILTMFGIPLLPGLALYGLDALAGWLHRRRTRRHHLDF